MSLMDVQIKPGLGSIQRAAEALRVQSEKQTMAEREQLAHGNLRFFLTDAVHTLNVEGEGALTGDEKYETYPNVWYGDRPDYRKDLKVLLDVWEKEQFVLYPKSRQMMMSWTMVACWLWQAMTKPDEMVFFQSDIEDKAGFKIKNQSLLSRAEEIYNRLPYNFGIKITTSKKPPVMTFSNGSVIQGIPQTSTAPRYASTTGVFGDEVAFQPFAHEAFTSVRPTLGTRGRYSGVSTVNGHDSFFYVKCHDLDRHPVPKEHSVDLQKTDKYPLLRGLDIWKNTNGFVVCQFHHTADPKKRSEEWIDNSKIGLDALAWAQEVNIDWDVYLGAAFFPGFKEERHIAKKHMEPLSGIPILRGWDFGFKFPAVVFCQIFEGTLLILDEFHEPDIETDEFAKKVIGFSYEKFPNCQFRDACDANGTKHDRRITDVETLEDYGLSPTYEWVSDDKWAWSQLKKYFAVDYGTRPGLLVNPNCHYVIEGLKGQMKYPNYKVGTRVKDDPVERHPYIDIFDALKYVAMNFGGDLVNTEVGVPKSGFDKPGWGKAKPITSAPRDYMSM